MRRKTTLSFIHSELSHLINFIEAYAFIVHFVLGKETPLERAGLKLFGL